MAGLQSLLGGLVTVNSTGLTRLTGNVADIVDTVLRKGAFDVVDTAVAIAEQKHIVDTGDLVNSIQVQFPRSKKLFYFIGPTVDYAIFQEFGSRGRAARPFMRPALNKHRPFILAAAAKAIEQGGSN